MADLTTDAGAGDSADAANLVERDGRVQGKASEGLAAVTGAIGCHNSGFDAGLVALQRIVSVSRACHNR